jgi:hypothetical protein
MKLRPLALLIVFVVSWFSPAAQAQVKNSPLPTTPTKSEPPVKLLKAPIVPFPDEALKKNIVGKVELHLVVNAEGRVSDAKIVSGPPEFYQAALDSVSCGNSNRLATPRLKQKRPSPSATQSPVPRQ